MRSVWVACLVWFASPGRSVRADALVAARTAWAEPGPALSPEPIRSSYWRAIVEPEATRADHLVRQGRALLYPAVGLGMLLGNEVAVQRRIAITSALARFERAVQLAPTHREARLFYGKALSFWEPRPNGDEANPRAAEAIAQLLALRTLDPAYEAEEVAFQLGVLYTRTGDFAAAVREYEHALVMNSDGEDNGSLLGNLAEVTMLQGDVARSLSLYERAARDTDGGSRALALWGVAIALDRLGDRAAALTQAQRALAQDRAPLAALHQAGVFFVPAHEIHYYEGLGALALADAERKAGEPLTAVAQRGVRWLDAPESLAALAPIERALAVLHETEHAQALASLRTRVTKARATLQRHAMPSALQRSDGQAKVESGSAPPLEVLPHAREAVALLWTLRALVSFQSYLAADGGSGPFADDTREHIAALRRVLSH